MASQQPYHSQQRLNEVFEKILPLSMGLRSFIKPLLNGFPTMNWQTRNMPLIKPLNQAFQ